MSKKVGVLNFKDTINAMFVKYGNEVMNVVDDAMKEVARESVEDLKAVRGWSSSSFAHPTGEYSKDWTWDIQPSKRLTRIIVVYNDEHYRLTHLLESGHSKYLWGRATGQSVRAYPHIKPVADKANEHLEDAITRRIEDINVDKL